MKSLIRTLLLFIIVLTSSNFSFSHAEKDTFWYYARYTSDGAGNMKTLRVSGVHGFYRYDADIEKYINKLELDFEDYLIEKYDWHNTEESVRENTLVIWNYRKTKKATLKSINKDLNYYRKKGDLVMIEDEFEFTPY